MTATERPLIDSFREVADLCGQRPPYAILARMGHIGSAGARVIKFAEHVSYDDVSFDLQARRNDDWRMWTDRLSYDQAKIVSSPGRAGGKEESLRDYTGLHIPRLVSLFARRFENCDDLLAGAETLVTWMGLKQSFSTSEKTGIDRAVATSALQWMRIEDRPINTLMDCLAGPGDARLRLATTKILGRIFMKGSASGYSSQSSFSFTDEKLQSAVEAADAAALLDEDFWLDSGVRAAGGVRRPTLLPLLHKQLSQKLDATQGAYNMQLLARAYITSVLQAHQQDPNRHTTNIDRLLETVRPKKGTHRAVDLSALVNVSNVIAKQINKRLPSVDRDENILAALRPADMVHLSDAFLRILHVTRRSDVPATVQAKQFEEDVYHAEIVALLREGVVDPLRIAGHAALSQAPQAKALRQHLQSGKTLTEALQLLRHN